MKRLSQSDQGSTKIINVANGTASNDAVNKSQLDTKLTTSGATTITVSTSAPGSPSVGDLWVDTN